MCHAPMMHCISNSKLSSIIIYSLLKVFRQPNVFKDGLLPGAAEQKLALTQRSTIIYNLASILKCESVLVSETCGAQQKDKLTRRI